MGHAIVIKIEWNHKGEWGNPTLQREFENFDEANARYQLIVASGGPSVLEFVRDAAALELGPGPGYDEVKSLERRFREAAEALTPEQREVATAFYFDDTMAYLDAIEAARLTA